MSARVALVTKKNNQMAADRYSRILASAKYYPALDNYIKYMTDAAKRGARVGKGEARPESIRLFVDPFGIEMAVGQRAPVSAAKPGHTAWKDKFGTRVTDQAPATEALIIKPQGFKAARVVIKTGVSTQGTVKTSAVTGMPYLSYGGKSTSIPFGRKDANDTVTAAFDELKAAIVTGQTPPRVSLIPERV